MCGRGVVLAREYKGLCCPDPESAEPASVEVSILCPAEYDGLPLGRRGYSAFGKRECCAGYGVCWLCCVRGVKPEMGVPVGL
jgi:hypothetical protein